MNGEIERRRKKMREGSERGEDVVMVGDAVVMSGGDMVIELL